MWKSDRAASPKTGAAKKAEAGKSGLSGETGRALTNRTSPRPDSQRNRELTHPDFRKGRKPGNRGRHPDSGRPDYQKYRLTAGESMKYLGVYVALDACVSYLFFSSVAVFLLFLPGGTLFLWFQKQSLQEKRKRTIRGQFLDAIQLMLAALQAGYSSENAMHETRKELRKIYDERAVIVQEFDYMDTQLRMSRNLEDLFLDFARRSGVEDIMSFSEVLLTAKRTGGDLISIIRNTVSCIRQKQETTQEIETCLAGKVMEQNIMSMVPILILAYIRLSSPEYLDTMYHSEAGILVMTVCFAVYILAYLWGRRIVRIEV